MRKFKAKRCRSQFDIDVFILISLSPPYLASLASEDKTARLKTTTLTILNPLLTKHEKKLAKLYDLTVWSVPMAFLAVGRKLGLFAGRCWRGGGGRIIKTLHLNGAVY